VTAAASGYDPQTKPIALASRQTATLDFHLAATPLPGSLQGRVTDKATGAGLVGATVHLHDAGGDVDQTATTGAGGAYNVPNLAAGQYIVDAAADKYVPVMGLTVSVTVGPSPTVLDIQL